MNFFKIFSITPLFILLLSISVSCQKEDPVGGGGIDPTEKGSKDLNKEYNLPNIDLSHWKVTLPIGDPMEIAAPEILNYATDERLKSFMYNDSTDGSLVFYTYPVSSTANSSYSRTELREQMIPGNNNVNWTFEEGGKMRGTLSVPEISKNENGEYDKTIVMQIHGRLTNEQRDLIGEDDNNAPPILKIYWFKGKVRVKTKILKDVNASDTEILKTDAWGDDEGYNFSEEVGHNRFTLEINASKGRLEVTLNDKESIVYDDVHKRRWNIFKNYFKAGNYLSSTNPDSFAFVKYYDLTVEH